MSEYNGWKNYETWNVALWISNDEGLYNIAKEMQSTNHNGYNGFLEQMEKVDNILKSEHVEWSIGLQTPDGVAWNDSGLDIEALDEMIAEL